MGIVASAVAYPLLGLSPPDLLSADAAFIVFMICTAAGGGGSLINERTALMMSGACQHTHEVAVHWVLGSLRFVMI